MSDVAIKRCFTTAILHADRAGGVEHGALHKPLHLSVAYGYRDVRDLAACRRACEGAIHEQTGHGARLHPLEQRVWSDLSRSRS